MDAMRGVFVLPSSPTEAESRLVDSLMALSSRGLWSLLTIGVAMLVYENAATTTTQLPYVEIPRWRTSSYPSFISSLLISRRG
jgi:hypothetical protein